jgi:hypothetical protein
MRCKRLNRPDRQNQILNATNETQQLTTNMLDGTPIPVTTSRSSTCPIPLQLQQNVIIHSFNHYIANVWIKCSIPVH